MTSTATTTAACGHTTETESQLCPGCTRGLRGRLDRMPKLWVALEAWLPPGGRRPELGHAPAVEAPLPVREAVLDLRADGGIVKALEDWWTAIHEARDFTVPSFSGPIPQRIGIAARAIRQNLTWISLTWDAGLDLAEDIRALEQRCLNVISPPDNGRFIGHCPAIDHRTGDICGAPIRVPTGTSDVLCGRCDAAYPPSAWLSMRRWMDHDQEQAEAEAAS